MICTAEALPVEDMQLPNKQALQLKWFYMSFHYEDSAKYVEMGNILAKRRLSLS
jgi:hypothetical protein